VINSTFATCVQNYHANNEIFSSKHADDVPADSVLWTCAVLPMETYVSYLNFERWRSDKPGIVGPVAPDPAFEPRKHLASCRELGRASRSVVGLGARKRQRVQEPAHVVSAAGSGVIPLEMSVQHAELMPWLVRCLFWQLSFLPR
jgi:hypothetical protein